MSYKYKTVIIDILKRALKKETAAFNYYIKKGKDSSIPEITSLFSQLAEEERKHRYFLTGEIERLDSLLQGSSDKDFLRKDSVKYQIPDSIDFKTIKSTNKVDIAAVSLPTELLGGDYLDTVILNRRSKEPALGILLFDVMGHGIEASELKSKMREHVGKFLESSRDSSSGRDVSNPALLISHINLNLFEECRRAGRFITALYSVIDTQGMRMEYTSAGHNPPILIRGDSVLYDPDATDLLIGAEREIGYSTESHSLDEGDVIVIFSDGITETYSRGEEMFGEEGLIRSVRESRNLSSREIIKSIFDSLRIHVGGEPLRDDFSLTVVKILPDKDGNDGSEIKI